MLPSGMQRILNFSRNLQGDMPEKMWYTYRCGKLKSHKQLKIHHQGNIRVRALYTFCGVMVAVLRAIIKII